MIVIIPARNEGQGLIDTLDSLYAVTDCKVIVVNDYSDTDKWIQPKKHKGLKVIKAPPFSGFGGAIQLGIDSCTDENIFICGARTRFTEGWYEKTEQFIEDNPESISCAVNAILFEDQTEISKAEEHAYGAEIYRYKSGHWMKWIINLPVKEMPEGDEIDCAYGGSYALKRSWWNKIHGLDLIQGRGGCNQFLSLKTWMAGGSVRVIKDVTIGNIYRVDCSYAVTVASILYNRIMIMSVLYGTHKGLDTLQSYKRYREYEILKSMFARNLGILTRENKYMRKIKKGSINNHLKQKENG